MGLEAARGMSELRWISAAARMPPDGQIVGVKMISGGQIEYCFGLHMRRCWLLEDGLQPEPGWEISEWVPIRCFACPLCGMSAHPNTLSSASIAMARCSCRHCANEFLIVGNEAMSLIEYLERHPELARKGYAPF